MKVQVVSSASGPGPNHQFLTSYLIEDRVAIDAGCIGYLSPVSLQKQIRFVFLSHSHIDHIASLPSFVDNIYEPGPDCATVLGNQHVLDCLRQDIFNDRVWPDMIRLSDEETPFLRLEQLEAYKAVEKEGVKVTPIPINHVVPTFGFLVEKEDSAIAIVSDTAETQEIWDVLQDVTTLKAVFLEASFPNSMQWLADKSLHLTPKTFGLETKKLDREVQWLAVHRKAEYAEQLAEELFAESVPNLAMAEPGKEYHF